MKTAPHSTFALVVVLLGAGLLLLVWQPRIFSRVSFTKSVEVTAPSQDRGYYYRFKADLAYKGEPLNFDIVVGCRVKVTTYKDNDRTVEINIAPMVYGLKMKDGRGVVVRPPEACDGETTENSKVPATLLPFVVTYENADAPWFGRAYLSEDAYISPISELKFFGATVSRATREDWLEWRRTEAPKNFVTYELLGINAKNIWTHPHWRPGYRVMGTVCTGFSWVKLPEPVREAIRPFWPTSQPRFWWGNSDVEWAFRKAAGFATPVHQDPQKGLLLEGHRLLSYLGSPPHLPEVKFLSKDSAIGTLYPASSDFSFNRLDDAGNLPPEITAKSKKSFAEVRVNPQLKGFAYCDTPYPNIDDVPSAISFAQPYVDRIDGETINGELGHWNGSFIDAFERDEFVIFYRNYWMVSAFGGL